MTLKVAQVGCGYFARFHADAWQRMAAAGDVEYVALCDRDLERAQATANEFGAGQVFSDVETMLGEASPDLVDIVTPPDTHASYVRAATDAGAQVICQKPFAGGYAAAVDLVETLGDAAERVFVHENIRFQPWYAELKRQLDAGVVGEMLQLSFRLRPGDGQGEQAYLDRQPYFQQMPRFLVHETAIHWIDTFRYLCGEVESVYAQLKRLNPVIAGEDAGVILFDFAGGPRAIFDGNRLLDHAADNRRLTMGDLLLEGTAGTLALDGYGVIRLRRFGESDWIEQPYAWDDINFGGDCVLLTNRHIVRHLRQSTPVVNRAAEYLVNLRLVEAVYQSAESDRRIDMATFRTGSPA